MYRTQGKPKKFYLNLQEINLENIFPQVELHLY